MFLVLLKLWIAYEITLKPFDQTIEIFQKDPCHPTLKNHKLKGKFKDRRAISAGGDIRLIFEEYENYTLVLFLSVGSHNQVY